MMSSSPQIVSASQSSTQGAQPEALQSAVKTELSEIDPLGVHARINGAVLIGTTAIRLGHAISDEVVQRVLLACRVSGRNDVFILDYLPSIENLRPLYDLNSKGIRVHFVSNLREADYYRIGINRASCQRTHAPSFSTFRLSRSPLSNDVDPQNLAAVVFPQGSVHSLLHGLEVCGLRLGDGFRVSDHRITDIFLECGHLVPPIGLNSENQKMNVQLVEAVATSIEESKRQGSIVLSVQAKQLLVRAETEIQRMRPLMDRVTLSSRYPGIRLIAVTPESFPENSPAAEVQKLLSYGVKDLVRVSFYSPSASPTDFAVPRVLVLKRKSATTGAEFTHFVFAGDRGLDLFGRFPNSLKTIFRSFDWKDSEVTAGGRRINYRHFKTPGEVPSEFFSGLSTACMASL